MLVRNLQNLDFAVNLFILNLLTSHIKFNFLCVVILSFY